MTNTAISALPEATSATQDDLVPIVQAGITKKASRKDFLKGQQLENYTEKTHSYGTVSSGTFTPDHDANGNNHIVAVGGDITIAEPDSNFTSGLIEGSVEMIDGDVHTITWGGGWDWGDAGEPTLTAKSIIGYRKGYGDAKTKVWHLGGFL